MSVRFAAGRISQDLDDAHAVVRPDRCCDVAGAPHVDAVPREDDARPAVGVADAQARLPSVIDLGDEDYRLSNSETNWASSAASTSETAANSRPPRLQRRTLNPRDLSGRPCAVTSRAAGHVNRLMTWLRR